MNDYDKLMSEMYDVISKQNESGVETYDFNFYQERRYRISEKIEDILPESKKLALHMQHKMHTSMSAQEHLRWMDESPELLHNWDGEIHQKYLKKAEKILAKTDYLNAKKIIDIIFK